MKLYFADHKPLPLPEGHSFPLPKYYNLRQGVTQAQIVPQDNLIPATPADDEQLLRVHTSDYLGRLVRGEMSGREMRRIGFPWSPQLVERSRASVGATIAACRSAMSDGIAANMGGGTHHAYPDHGEGYCVFNDVAVAARAMQAERRLRRVLIIDLDVHQGNGTAAIFAQDPSVFTFSVHGARNFPFHKERSDLDIALPDGSQDEAFLEVVEAGVERALAMSSADLAIYIAGADPFEGDRLGRMAVSKVGLAQRDRLVFAACQAAGLPVTLVMGGGYARNVQDIVDIHIQTIRIAAEFQALRIPEAG